MIDVSLHRHKALQVREHILSESPQLEQLLDFADLVHDAVMRVDQSNGMERLDGLNQVWSWKRSELLRLAVD